MNDTATIIALLVGVVIPHLSSIASNTKYIPTWAGGYVTLVLSGLSGFLAEWQQAGSNFRWQDAALTSLVTFVMAALSRLVVHRDTPPETELLKIGSVSAQPSPGGRHAFPDPVAEQEGRIA